MERSFHKRSTRKKPPSKKFKKNPYIDPIEYEKTRCSAVRIDGAGGSMEHITPKVQLLGNCYAHSASQMYDAWRFKHQEDLGNYSSPFEIHSRLQYENLPSNKRPSTLGSGGNEYKVLQEYLKNGSCPLTEKGTLQSGAVYEVDYAEQRYKNIDSKLSQLASTYEYESNTPIETRFIDSVQIKSAFNQICADCKLNQSSNKNFKEIHSILSSPSPLKLMNDNELSCKNKLKTKYPFSPKWTIGVKKGVFVGSDEPNDQQLDLLRLIHKELNKGPLNAYPVSVGYCSNILYKGPSKRVISVGGPHCGAHASLIIGRQFNTKTNRCEFLIRNSWGDLDASSYKGYSVDGKNKYNIWVPEKDVGRFLFDVTTLN
jgi:hypothetical protein